MERIGVLRLQAPQNRRCFRSGSRVFPARRRQAFEPSVFHKKKIDKRKLDARNVFDLKTFEIFITDMAVAEIVVSSMALNRIHNVNRSFRRQTF